MKTIIIKKPSIPKVKEKVLVPSVPALATTEDQFFAEPKIARLMARLAKKQILTLTQVRAPFGPYFAMFEKPLRAISTEIEKVLAQDSVARKEYQRLSVRISHLEDTLALAEEAGKAENRTQVDRLTVLLAERDKLVPVKLLRAQQTLMRRRRRLADWFRKASSLNDANIEAERGKNFTKMMKRIDQRTDPKYRLPKM